MKPYSNEGINKIYDLLFCDDLGLYLADGQVNLSETYPWRELSQPETSDDDLQRVVEDSALEARQRILAANILNERGSVRAGKRVFAVIVEVARDEGLDVVAAYNDGTARYINFSEKLIVWDARTDESDALIGELFSAARALVEQIGPWDRSRLPPPKAGNARISFLVSDGLYFGEAGFEVLARDQMGGAVIHHAAKLMAFLMQKSMDQTA